MDKKSTYDNFLNKMFGDLINGFLFKSKDVSLKLNDVEVKLPFAKESIKLSGDITVSFSTKKK